MKIISLDISNTRKIKAFRLTLDGKNLHVAGPTAGGKTTVINALWEILEKKHDTITHGEKKGHIKIKLSDGNKTIIAQRITTPKSSTLKLYDDDGADIGIKDFKQMISDLSVNPHKIMSMKPLEQTRTLLKAAEVGIDLEAVDAEIADLEQKRLQAHRDTEALKPGDEPERVEPVSVSSLVAERDRIKNTNEDNDRKRAGLKELTSKLVEAQEKAVRLLAEAREAVDKASNLEGDRDKLETLVASLEDTDLAPWDDKIAQADEINAKAQAYQNWKERAEQHRSKVQAHADLDADLKAKREAKAAALESAKWPLEGLAIEDGSIYYKGCLLDNLGESEQMLVCAALAIGDIKNHPLKVVRMDGIESMSPEDFQALTELFNGEGIQVLSTRVAYDAINNHEIQIVDGAYGKDGNE